MIYTECKPDSALVRTKFEKLIIDLKVKSKMMKALEKSIEDRRQK
jgi:hypothetical protein